MKKLFAPFVAIALLTGPALAQSKLDQAIAKADEQLRKGKPEEAVKTLTKAAEQAGAEGYVALGQMQERVGNLDEAAAAYGKAKSLAASEDPPTRAEVLATVVHFTLRVVGLRQGERAVVKVVSPRGELHYPVQAQWVARRLQELQASAQHRVVGDRAQIARISAAGAHRRARHRS